MSAAETRFSFAVERFRPARWLASPHGQTVGARLLRRARAPHFERVRIDTPDGDFLDLDFPHGAEAMAAAPLVVLFHGLEGSARRGYAINVYRYLRARGIAAVGLNFRSCSGEINRQPRFYHSGETTDIALVIRYLRERWPNRRLGAIGFSLGGNALLKYLGEAGDDTPLECGMAVSVPYDLGAGARLLEQSVLGRFYSRLFIKSLVLKAEAKLVLVQDKCDLARVRAARTFWEFDDAMTAPIHGFAGADDYYTRSSSYHFIERIRRPVLLLHAQDDPFVPADRIPLAAMRANPHITHAITKTGGHVGFIEGWPWRLGFWAERQAARWFERLKQ